MQRSDLYDGFVEGPCAGGGSQMLLPKMATACLSSPCLMWLGVVVGGTSLFDKADHTRAACYNIF